MEKFTITETDEGVIYKVETTIPDEPFELDWIEGIDPEESDKEDDNMYRDDVPIQQASTNGGWTPKGVDMMRARSNLIVA